MCSFPEIPIAGIVIEVVTSAAGMAIVVTGLVATALRALAVLGESSQERVEWMTSMGFVIGIVLSILLLAFDFVLG